MGQEFGICEMLQTRGIVGHNIGLPRDALHHVAVTVFPLVLRRKDALLGWRTIGRNCLLACSGLSWGVVHEGGCGGVLHRMASGHGANLSEHAGVFQVTVSDGAIWVVRRD